MKLKLWAIMMALLTVSVGRAQERKNDFNLNDSGVGIDGYDPVSYFTDHKPAAGDKAFSQQSNGVVYYFKSAGNRDVFKANPSKYEPAYGGWCAFAMGDSGEKVEVDPETFKIVDGKLYLFYNKFFNNTLNSWNKNEAELKNKADKNWQRLHHD